MKFLSSGFIHQLRLGPCLLYYIFFKLCFEFAKLFEFKIHTVLWAKGFKTWGVYALASTVDINTLFIITVPLKDMASLKKLLSGPALW
jgi:hypothetical protein